MIHGIQTFFDEAGDAACYALDIIQIAEEETKKRFEPSSALLEAAARGYLHYNENDPNDNMNFFVRDPGKMLSMLTGERWVVEKVGSEYKPKPGERIVERWERVSTGKTIGHFRLPHWDSLTDSKTVRFGSIASKRVFRRIT